MGWCARSARDFIISVIPTPDRKLSVTEDDRTLVLLPVWENGKWNWWKICQISESILSHCENLLQDWFYDKFVRGSIYRGTNPHGGGNPRLRKGGGNMILSSGIGWNTKSIFNKTTMNIEIESGCAQHPSQRQALSYGYWTITHDKTVSMLQCCHNYNNCFSLLLPWYLGPKGWKPFAKVGARVQSGKLRIFCSLRFG